MKFDFKLLSPVQVRKKNPCSPHSSKQVKYFRKKPPQKPKTKTPQTPNTNPL